MEKISSRENSHLKFARRVCERREEGFVFAEGFRLAEEILRSNINIAEAFFADDFGSRDREENLRHAIIERAKFSALLSDKLLASISDTKTPQGIVLICAEPKIGREVIEKRIGGEKSYPLIVVLHKINNPANLGAILRTAEAAGVTGIITTQNSADVFSTKSVRSSMGAVFRLAIWKDAIFGEVIEWANTRRLSTVFSDSNGSSTYAEFDWTVPRMLIVGSEGHGLSGAEKSVIAESVRIPMMKQVESVNIGVACGVILFEALRQRARKNR